MLTYETVIHIITEGYDRLDAGEKAGAIIDTSKITDDMIVRCESTRVYRNPIRQSNVSSSGQCLVGA